MDRRDIEVKITPPESSVALELSIGAPTTLASLLPRLGVAPEAVDVVLVNSAVADVCVVVGAGDQVTLLPPLPAGDLEPLRCVCDAHLGRLARYLRMFGCDTLYRNDYPDPEIARISDEDGRVLFTRDRGLLREHAPDLGYFVAQRLPHAQLLEVVAAFDLGRRARPLSRCLRCNGLVVAVSRESVARVLPEGVRRRFCRFWRCAQCGRVYWKGTHYHRMRQFLLPLLKEEVRAAR